MSDMLPQGVEEGDEVEIDWEAFGARVNISATLGDAVIMIEFVNTDESAGRMELLCNGIPGIIQAVNDAIESQEDE